MDYDEKLIEEYKTTSESVRHLERTIWGSTGLVSFGNIGSLLIMADRSSMNPFIGILLIIFTWVWWRIAKRWWDIQHTFLLRIRHIETLLCLSSHLYVGYRDEILDLKAKSELEKKLDSADPKFLSDLKKKPQGFEKRGVQKWMKWVPIAITIFWAPQLFNAFLIFNRQVDMEKAISLNLISLILGILGVLGIGLFLGFMWGKSKKWEWAAKEFDTSAKLQEQQNKCSIPRETCR